MVVLLRYGRQVDSFQDSITIESKDDSSRSIKASFIRAPKITSIGKNVDVLCKHNNEVVGVKQGIHMAVTCHPELQNEILLHKLCFES